MMTLKKLDNDRTISSRRFGRKEFTKERNNTRGAQFLCDVLRYDDIKLQLVTRVFPSRVTSSFPFHQLLPAVYLLFSFSHTIPLALPEIGCAL